MRTVLQGMRLCKKYSAAYGRQRTLETFSLKKYSAAAGGRIFLGYPWQIKCSKLDGSILLSRQNILLKGYYLKLGDFAFKPKQRGLIFIPSARIAFKKKII